MQHHGIAVAGFVAILLGAIDGIERIVNSASQKSREIAGGFFGSIRQCRKMGSASRSAETSNSWTVRSASVSASVSALPDVLRPARYYIAASAGRSRQPSA